MARYKITGTVYLSVAFRSTETQRIDDEFEGENEEQARRAAEDWSGSQWWHADEVDVEDSRLTVTLILESPEELAERERVAVYRSMIASGAPRLPGMEAIA